MNLLQPMDIITNSLDSCSQLNGELHHVFLLPGRKREKNGALVGNWTEKYLEGIRADVCLLGTSGLLGGHGITCHSYQELGVKQAMIRQSDLVFVLADSGKFREKGFHLAAGWDEIDGIITDHHLSPKLYDEYSRKVPVYIKNESLEV